MVIGRQGGQPRQRGSTLFELIIAMVLLGTMILLLVILTNEMTSYERKLPLNYMIHPQVSSVMARLRRDVSSAYPPYYESSEGAYRMSSTILILETLLESGGVQTVVWDFSRRGEVHRHAFTAHMEMAQWTARGLPQFTLDAFSLPVPGKPDSVRIRGFDAEGKLAIDQIFQPRSH